jgi:hypothetical protein
MIMNNFLVIATKKSPEIILIADGILMIKGSSHPVDVTDFYKPVFNWLGEFKKDAKDDVRLTLDLDYIDTPSTRVILELLKTVIEFASDKTKVKITWKYEHEDHDMLEQGKIYETKAAYPFEFIEKPAS